MDTGLSLAAVGALASCFRLRAANLAALNDSLARAYAPAANRRRVKRCSLPVRVIGSSLVKARPGSTTQE